MTPTFSLDTSKVDVKFKRPSILTHPNIPRALAGINPRSIMGRDWWDEQRKAAYKVNGGHCWACGLSSSRDPYHPWLEGHEYYEFDYDKGTMTFIEVVALCHCCHNFIHSGRLMALYEAHAIDYDKTKYILNHGLAVLSNNSTPSKPLKPFIGTKMVYYQVVEQLSQAKAMAKAWQGDKLEWPQGPHYPLRWRMVFDGTGYIKSRKAGVKWQIHEKMKT